MFFRASYNDLNEKHQPDAVNKYIFHLCSVSTYSFSDTCIQPDDGQVKVAETCS